MISETDLKVARTKAYLRLLPILIVCYIIAYVDRNNVAIAKLTMVQDLPEFNERIFGFGMGIFFLGYFLLEIPGSLLVERWSASKWICRIMVTWGVIAAATAFVKTPAQFYAIRFLLGLAEAGFFPGVIVYLTHWFPEKDRARALAMFFIASPIAMMLSPIVSQLVLHFGTTEIVDGVAVTYPPLFGLHGWQWIYIMWGIPAILLGAFVPFILPDHPRHAKWLTTPERTALESVLGEEHARRSRHGHLSLWRALSNPKVILLSIAYFGAVAGNYGVESFLPSILKSWYELTPSQAALLTVMPSILVLASQLLIGWSSDHFHERRWHAVIPIALGVSAFLVAPWTRGSLVLTLICFMVAAAGMKAYMPAFWALPSMFMSSAAAAASIGMINSFGNLGGFVGPYVLGYVKDATDSYDIGLYCLAATGAVSVMIIFSMRFPPIAHHIASDVHSAEEDGAKQR
jgi:ACS family tartrate transporter-like MFS transporter